MVLECFDQVLEAISGFAQVEVVSPAGGAFCFFDPGVVRVDFPGVHVKEVCVCFIEDLSDAGFEYRGRC